MGKFLDKFKNIGSNVSSKVRSEANEYVNREKGIKSYRGNKIHERDQEEFSGDMYDGIDDIEEEENYSDPYDVGIQPSQKPESFHHFILENQYKDLERSIRGFKDVFDKETQSWKTIRKKEHCFTDEEAEEILRTAQSHLATDIKLSYINKEVIGLMMNTLYDQISLLFYSISEYRYGRYGAYDKQYQMKLQNMKIFLELWARIQANYSRAIGGQENKYTHDSVKAQESLQQVDRDYTRNRGYS